MIKINNSDEIEVYNVIPVYRNGRIIKFITSVSLADINLIYEKLIYDEKTQRGFKNIKNKKQEIIDTKRIVNERNIKEMQEKMLNSFFDGGHLVWNIRIKDVISSQDYFEHNLEENKIVLKSDKITLPDSAQRHMAIHNLKAYSLMINQDRFYMPLDICFYTLTEEQSLFSEINGCGERANRTRSLYLSNNDKSLLLKEIIKESALQGCVEYVSSFTLNKDSFVPFSTLYNSLFDNRSGAYKNISNDDIYELKDWLIRFYDYLFEVEPNFKLKTWQERKSIAYSSIIYSAPMFFAYAYLSKLLKNDRNWKRKLERLTKPFRAGQWEGDILSLDNPIFHGTVCVENKFEQWKVVNNRRSADFCSDILAKHLNLTNL